jgi:hypothetical protein
MKNLYMKSLLIVVTLICMDNLLWAQTATAPFKVLIRVDGVYSNAWENQGSTPRHRWRFRFAVDNEPMSGDQGCYLEHTSDRDKYWPKGDVLFRSKDYEQMPGKVSVWFNGFEDEDNDFGCESKNNERFECSDIWNFDLNFKANQWVQQPELICKDGTFKARISIYYYIPAPKDNSFSIENIGGSSSTKFCKEADTIKLSIPTAQPYNNFGYQWEYHFEGDNDTTKNCYPKMSTTSGEVCLRDDINLVYSEDCRTYIDEDCQYCHCDDPTITERWYPFTGNQIKDANTLNTSSIKVIPFTQGDLNKIKFRVKLRHNSTGQTGPPLARNDYIFIYDAPPVIHEVPAVPTGSDTFLVALNDTVQVTPNIAIKHVQCKGSNTGKILIKNIAGTGKYYYTLVKVHGNPAMNIPDPGRVPTQDNPIIFPDHASDTLADYKDGLPAGLYTLYIENIDSKDSSSETATSGCYNFYPIYIKEPQSKVSVSAVHIPKNNEKSISCYGGSDGEVTVTATGGIGPSYTYRVHGNGYDQTYTLDAKEKKFSGLKAGTYTVKVTDATGSCSVSTSITLTQPDTLPYLVLKTIYPACNGANNGSVAVEGAGGSGEYSFSVDGVTYFQANADGNFITPSQYGRLSPATIYIKDKSGCITDTTFQVGEYEPLEFSSINFTEPLCYGDSSGKLTVTVTGGSSSDPNNFAGFVFSLNGKDSEVINGNTHTMILPIDRTSKSNI